MSTLWQGRIDHPEQADTLRWHQMVLPLTPTAAPGVALLGLASDEGVRRNGGRPGAAQGPVALRAALANLPVWHCGPLYDAGDIVCTSGALETAQAEYAARIAALLDAGHFPLGLGGGHEIAYASYLGLMTHLGNSASRVGMVNFDTHFDLRKQALASSGTPFLQALDHAADCGHHVHYMCLGVSPTANTRHLFTTADHRGVRYLRDEELAPWSLEDARYRLATWLLEVDVVYLSLCLDVLPQAVAPGVSAPSAHGISLEVLEALLDVVLATGKTLVADIAELSPPHDRDAATARVAARLLHRIAGATRYPVSHDAANWRAG
ncbi:MAG TPA: formimidoylglutamase [Lysobacter sp.]